METTTSLAAAINSLFQVVDRMPLPRLTAMAHFPPSILLLILILPFVSSSSNPAKGGLRVSLTNLKADQNLSPLQLIAKSIHSGKQRLDAIGASLIATNAWGGDVQAKVYGGNGEFRMNLSIGTPPVPFLAIMDTGSDLVWTQCKPCKVCFPQPTPLFDPTLSTSFANVSCTNPLCKEWVTSSCADRCEYNNTYGDDTSTKGFLGTETLTFGSSERNVSVPNIGFGCGVENDGSGLNDGSGIVGLGRGPLSLVSQIGSRHFSYCLASIAGNESSSLFFGSVPNFNVSDASIKSTPLIKNPVLPSFYYVSLEGITVGLTRLNIPSSLFQLNKDGSGGFIIDSGTTITLIHEDAFNVLRPEFLKQTDLRRSFSDETGLELCFVLPDATEIKVPKLIFHFAGGLDLELPPENYMIVDKKMGLVCLAMGPGGGMSTFGNIQQQNLLVMHDTEKETISFIHTNCGKI